MRQTKKLVSAPWPKEMFQFYLITCSLFLTSQEFVRSLTLNWLTVQSVTNICCVRTHDERLHQKSTFKPKWPHGIFSGCGCRVQALSVWTEELFSHFCETLTLIPINIWQFLFKINYILHFRDRLSCYNSSIVVLSRASGFVILWLRPTQNTATHSTGKIVRSLWATLASLHCWQRCCLRKKSKVLIWWLCLPLIQDKN